MAPRPSPPWRWYCGDGNRRSVVACFTRLGLYGRHRIDVFQLCPADDVSLLAGRPGRVVIVTRIPLNTSGGTRPPLGARASRPPGNGQKLLERPTGTIADETSALSGVLGVKFSSSISHP